MWYSVSTKITVWISYFLQHFASSCSSPIVRHFVRGQLSRKSKSFGRVRRLSFQLHLAVVEGPRYCLYSCCCFVNAINPIYILSSPGYLDPRPRPYLVWNLESVQKPLCRSYYEAGNRLSLYMYSEYGERNLETLPLDWYFDINLDPGRNINPPLCMSGAVYCWSASNVWFMSVLEIIERTLNLQTGREASSWPDLRFRNICGQSANIVYLLGVF